MVIKLGKDTPVPPRAYECSGCSEESGYWPADDLIWWSGVCYERDAEYLRRVENGALPGWYCQDCIEAISWEPPLPDDFGPKLSDFLEELNGD